MNKSISVPLHRILSPPYKWWELYISCSRLTFSVTVRQIASPGRHPWSLFPIYNSQSIGGRRCGLCGTYLRVRVGILSRLSQRAPWSLCLINAAVTHQKLDFSLFLHSPPFPQFQEGLYVCSDSPSRRRRMSFNKRTKRSFIRFGLPCVCNICGYSYGGGFDKLYKYFDWCRLIKNTQIMK